MASRLDFSQIRSLYIGTSSGTTVDTNNLIVVGNVGIGTTSPGYKLHVAGNGAFTGIAVTNPDTSGTFNRSSIDVSSNQITMGFTAWGQGSVRAGTAWVQTVNNYPLVLGTNDNEVMRLLTNGNVGINQTAPTQKLDVFGNISLGSWTKAGNTYVGLRRDDDGTFGNGGDSGLVIESYNHAVPYNGNYSQRVHLRTHLYNGGSHDVITGYGLNVGIGTTAPADKLDVRGTFRVVSDNAINAKILYYTASPYGMVFRAYGSGANSIQVQREANDAELFPLILQPNGSNVGIGTTSPSSILQLGPGSYTSTNSAYNSFTAGSFGVLFRDAYDSYITFNTVYGPSGWVNKYGTARSAVVNFNDGALDISTGSGTTAGGASGLTTKLVMTNGGNVGINTTSPQNKLTVNSPARYDGESNSLGAIVVAGPISNSPSFDFTNSTAVFRIQGSDATNNLQFGIGGDTYDYSPWIQASYDNSSGGGSDFGAKSILLQPIGGIVGIGTSSPYTGMSTRLFVGDAQSSSVINRNQFISVGVAGGSTNQAGINFLIYNAGYGGRIYTDDNTVRALAFDVLENGTFYNAMNITRTTVPRVGIGTTTPSSKLHISGTTTAITLTDTTYSRTSSIGYLDNANLYFANDPASNTLIGAYNGVFLAYGGGNVGVNTTSPAYKLDVIGSVRSYTGFTSNGYHGDTFIQNILPAGNNGANTGNVQLRMWCSEPGITWDWAGFGYNVVNDGTAPYGFARLNSNFGQAYMRFSTDGSMYFYNTTTSNVRTTTMTLSPTGSVGINTTSPNEKLTVLGSDATTFQGAGIYNSYTYGNSNKAESRFNLGKLEGSTYQPMGAVGGFPTVNTDSANGILSFYTRTSQSVTEKMRITDGGNVGINTTSPAEKLSVVGNIRAGGNVIASVGLGYGNYISMRHDDNNGYITITRTVYDGNLILEPFANVGISTSNPLSKLHVAGDARITSGSLGVGVAPNATDGRIDASNDIVAFSSSDIRLKKNIKPIENALDKVKSLTGVEFDWKPELKHAHGYEGHDTGVIAQEVQDVMPTAIRTNDTGYLAVRYEKLIGLLIEANKELAARVEELESKLK